MSRYLTPAKIGLLTLIELYTESCVPTSSTITILAFIISHLLPSTIRKSLTAVANEGQRGRDGTFVISVQDFEKLLSPHPSASGLPGRSLWDLFVTKLWEVDSLDALHVFFERRSHIIARSGDTAQKESEAGGEAPDSSQILLSRASPCGSFVRRAELEFARLKFHDSLKLWKSFIAYRQVTFPVWRKRQQNARSWSFDGVLCEIDEDCGPDASESLANVAYSNLLVAEENTTGIVSTDDVEKLLEFQVEQMQKTGNRVPDKVRDQLQRVLDSNVIIPSLSHYVRFLDAWRAGDYSTSFDNLHRFFDYTMQNRDRLFYQYALLNLAILQADFGCFQEAVAAMQETVATARENKDMGCLNFSLSWLYHFGKAHPHVIKDTDRTNMLGVEREGLAFLRAKAKESGMWSLWSSSLLSEAKMGLASGESIAIAFENILRSSQLTVTKSLINNVGAQMMLQSSLWSRLGNAHLSSLYCETFLRCHSQLAPSDDVLKFTCRAAYILTQRGKYEEAMRKLEEVDANSLRSVKANQYWVRFRGLLRLKRNLLRNNLDGAESLLTQLLQCHGGEADLAFELNHLHIDTMIRRKNYHKALSTIEDLAAVMEERGDDVFFRAKLLVMKAFVLQKCGRPQRGFSVAVRAACVAWRARLLPVLWYAIGSIANILSSLGEFEASSQVLTSIMPRALECEDCALSAQIFSLLVDAFVGMAGQEEAGSPRRIQKLTSALHFVDRAFNEYSAIEDVEGKCEMMAKKATIMRLVGDLILANDYAAAYMDLRKESNEGVT
ncbi:MAG: anaphase promoting complex subunit 5 [Claussenomyces sp. TS43310]|nr:MAG: anaphase promoting complex subunit 5 [Claussenomyces sp. TS43310]